MIIVKSNKFLIDKFTILGERHCGTNFLEEYVSKICSIPVTWEYGWKHFFIPYNDKILSSQNTLFIGIVRNPYDWLAAMYKKHYHINAESKSCLIDFLKTSPIESIGPKNNLIESHNNIFELRNSKNKYLLDIMPNICNNYLLINYEVLCDNIQLLNETIVDNFNINNHTFISNTFQKTVYNLSDEEKTVINNNLNWNIENLLGYYKIL